MKTSGLTALWTLSLVLELANAASDASHTLRYVAPPSRNFFDALPIGNGRIGGMLHGYVEQDLIQLNEETIWSGGPMDKVPPTAAENLETLRQQILDGNLTEAGETWSAHFIPEYDDMRRYQPAGELRIAFPHVLNDTTDYQRSLDISTGIATVSYTHGGVAYTREGFGNFPHNVLGFKLSADSEGKLEFGIALTRNRSVVKTSADATTGTLVLHGSGTEDETYRYASAARLVLVDGVGSIFSNDTRLSVRGATEAWLVYTAETAFHHPNATYSDLQSIVDARLEAAVETAYESLRTEAVDDYKQYYDRSSIDLGTSDEIGQQSIPARLANWKTGTNITSDPEFMSLQFNYGKYLLIQSSRPGTVPANLQGIWNQDFDPPWDSKFTLNINLEMNYWLAQPLDLREIAEPIVDLLDRLMVTGREIASGMYGADGWCCHHNTDITGDCTPYHGLTIAAPYPLGGAWVAFEAIEHFRFTGDEEFARDRILPILKGTMDFIYSWATERNGSWITNPSCSPENSYYIPEGMSVAGDDTGIDAGAMNDRAIMWEIMQGFVDISNALGLTEGVERAQAFRDKILPPVAGSYGQLLEYSREYEENEPGHRHFSPLVGLQPGSWSAPLTRPEDAEMSYTLLRHRMDNGGGGNSWAVTWASVLHARSFDAAHALQYAMELIARWTHPNLLSRNGGYYQIDGNSGFTASLVEMLLQSHAGVVHLGPAIPTTGMASGSLTGWKARGGFKVDMTWEGGVVTEAKIVSLLGGLLKVRVADGLAFTMEGGQALEEGVETEVGDEFVITVV